MIKAIPPLLIGMLWSMPTSILLDFVTDKAFVWHWSIYFWSFLLAISAIVNLFFFAVSLALWRAEK